MHIQTYTGVYIHIWTIHTHTDIWTISAFQCKCHGICACIVPVCTCTMLIYKSEIPHEHIWTCRFTDDTIFKISTQAHTHRHYIVCLHFWICFMHIAFVYSLFVIQFKTSVTKMTKLRCALHKNWGVHWTDEKLSYIIGMHRIKNI